MHTHCKIIKVLCFIRIIAYGDGEITRELGELPDLPEDLSLGLGAHVQKFTLPATAASGNRTPSSIYSHIIRNKISL